MPRCCDPSTPSSAQTDDKQPEQSSNSRLRSSQRQQRCCGCDHDGTRVAVSTVLHHLKTPWQYPNLTDNHFFCANPSCPVIYFIAAVNTERTANSSIDQRQLRTSVGQKSSAPDRTLCYCFGVSAADEQADPAIRQFVTEQTRQKHCACDIRNPSGRCCLANFPKQVK